MKTILSFYRADDGGQIVEWALFAGLLAVAAIAAWGILDGSVQTAFTEIGTAIVSQTDAVPEP